MNVAPAVVTTPEGVAEVAAALRTAGRGALDLEFVSEARYVPELCLVQVAWGDPEHPHVAALDPLVVDVRPVVELIADPHHQTVLHAAQGDLALLGQRFGLTAGPGVIDSQIAAAFLGLGDQIGYAALVQSLLGITLDKGAQFTDWARRPLTPNQLSYALDDVRYLHQLWPRVLRRLEAAGRLEWVREETARVARAAGQRPPPEEMFRRVKAWNQLRGRALGALAGLAAWRERTALALNRPPSWLIQDRTLLEIARTPPANVEALARQRGLREGVAWKHGEEILAAISHGAANPPPREARPPALPAKADVWVAVLAALVAARAKEAGLAARHLAARDELERLVAWWLDGDRTRVPADLPLLAGWRRELAGEALLSWLAGQSALVIDESADVGVRLA